MVGDVVALDSTEISGNDPAKKMVIARNLDNHPWPETGKEILESSFAYSYFDTQFTPFPKKHEKPQSGTDKHSSGLTSSVVPPGFPVYQQTMELLSNLVSEPMITRRPSPSCSFPRHQ